MKALCVIDSLLLNHPLPPPPPRRMTLGSDNRLSAGDGFIRQISCPNVSAFGIERVHFLPWAVSATPCVSGCPAAGPAACAQQPMSSQLAHRTFGEASLEGALWRARPPAESLPPRWSAGSPAKVATCKLPARLPCQRTASIPVENVQLEALNPYSLL